MKYLSTSILIAALFFAGATSANEIRTLKNMERERAELISAYLDDQVTVDARQLQIQDNQKRLVDLERMVLRDDRLLGSQNRLVRLAFENYDLSFLVHASTESEHAPIEQWVSEMGLSSEDIMLTESGRR
jgi:hypothetical protein